MSGLAPECPDTAASVHTVYSESTSIKLGMKTSKVCQSQTGYSAWSRHACRAAWNQWNETVSGEMEYWKYLFFGLWYFPESDNYDLVYDIST